MTILLSVTEATISIMLFIFIYLFNKYPIVHFKEVDLSFGKFIEIEKNSFMSGEWFLPVSELVLKICLI